MSTPAEQINKLSQNPAISFIPWIIYWVVTNGPSTWKYGALGALISALILSIPSFAVRRPKFLDIGTIVFFAIISAIAIFVPAGDVKVLEEYAQPISSFALALIAFGSMLFVPFTEQYARESVPREYWETPTFKQINRVLTLVWGAAFVLTGIMGLLAIEFPKANDWLNWILPIVVIIGTFKFTEWYPEQAAGRRR